MEERNEEKKKKWFSISWDGKGEEIILGCWVFHLATLFSSNWRKNWEGHVIEKKITKSLIYFSIISHLIIRASYFLKKGHHSNLLSISVLFHPICQMHGEKKKKFTSSHFSIIATFSIIPTKRNPGRGGGTFISLTGSIILYSSLLKPFFLVNIVWWWGPIVESKFYLK